MRQQIASLGTNLLVVVPGAATTSGVRGGFGSASTLSVTDADAIRRAGSAIKSVGYLNRQMGQVQYANHNWTTNIQGVSASYPAITNWSVVAGRPLTDADDDTSALVALLGQTVSRELFGPSGNPIGASVLVKGSPMRVVGLLAGKGQTPWGQDQDDLVMIPFSTAERKVLGVSAPTQAPAAAAATSNGSTPVYPSTAPAYPTTSSPFGVAPRLTGFVNSIYVEASTPAMVDTASAVVTHTLVERHHIQPGSATDFSVRNLSQVASAAEGSSRVLALLLATVASISLVVYFVLRRVFVAFEIVLE